MSSKRHSVRLEISLASLANDKTKSCSLRSQSCTPARNCENSSVLYRHRWHMFVGRPSSFVIWNRKKWIFAFVQTIRIQELEYSKFHSLWFDTNRRHVRPMVVSMDFHRCHRAHQWHPRRHANTIGTRGENSVWSIERRRSPVHPLPMSFAYNFQNQRAHTMTLSISTNCDVIHHEIAELTI